MYSNDDGQRRRDDEAAYQRRREADDAAHQRRREADEAASQRRREEERRVNDMLLRQKREQEDSVNDQFRRERNEEAQRHDADWEDWRRGQADSFKQASAQAERVGRANSAVATHTNSDAFDNPLLEIVVFGFRLGLVIAVVFGPPVGAYAALGILLSKFPLYAVDPSFAGAVARTFFNAVAQWAGDFQAFHFYLAREWRFHNFGTLLLYCLAFWVSVFAALWIIGRLFLLNRALGIVGIFTALVPVGLFIYVVVHFFK